MAKTVAVLTDNRPRWSVPNERLKGADSEYGTRSYQYPYSGAEGDPPNIAIQDEYNQPVLLHPVEKWQDLCRTMNPGFATNDSGTYWVLGGVGEWAISGGKLVHTADTGHTATATQDCLTAGLTYRVHLTVSSRTAGSFTVKAGSGGTASSAISTNGNYTLILTAVTDGVLTITPLATFDGSIDDVFVEDFSTGFTSENLRPGDMVMVENTEGLSDNGSATGFEYFVRDPNNRIWLRLLPAGYLDIS